MTTPTASPRAERLPHRVEFYDSDARLISAVAEFLRPALAGGSAVIVATEDHRHAIGAALLPVAGPTDAVDARVNVVAIDAQQLLDRFMAGALPDPESFRQEVGAVLREAAGTDGPVLVYGEMVALLWEQGDVDAAIALEDLWNDLATHHSFSLLCGYPSALFTDGDAALFDKVCARHTEVTGGSDIEPQEPVSVFLDDEETVECWQLPNAFPSAARARRQLRALLRDWTLEALVDDASLLITELVTNAVLHAASPVRVDVRRRKAAVRVEVSDVGAGMVRRPLPSLGATHGRGLLLVESVASEWGANFDGTTKTVWFELRGAPR